MKKIVLLVFVSIIAPIFAQMPGPKWVTILDLEDQRIFVDTSTIKHFQNQISVLSITFFKTPQKIESINSKASSVKSQILFNLGLQKYSTVGTLYYDDKLKILGESSLPGLTGGEAFSVPIDSNQVVANIYSYCLKFINRGEREITEKEFSGQSERARKTLEKLAPKESVRTEPVVSKPEVNKESQPQTVTETTKKDSIKKEAIVKPVEKDTTVKVVDNLAKKKEDALKALTSKRKTEAEGAIEANPKNNIYSDGGKYSFQISSWKNKAKAESEVAKLKAQGHTSFIVEAFVNERRGTWYRVRIGYF
ncbi:MAG: SPOR domain-containing protein, partial [Ignavibacteria bacterium]|nr:SPOR domain-containing protein [Ignavibacteria bacterium]